MKFKDDFSSDLTDAFKTIIEEADRTENITVMVEDLLSLYKTLSEDDAARGLVVFSQQLFNSELTPGTNLNNSGYSYYPNLTSSLSRKTTQGSSQGSLSHIRRVHNPLYNIDNIDTSKLEVLKVCFVIMLVHCV
jgi:hypothetical protein